MPGAVQPGAGPEHKPEPWVAQVSTQAISAGFSSSHGSDSAAVMAARALALRRGRSRGGGPAQAIGHGACGNRMSRAQSRAQQANAVRAGELRTQARKSWLTEETVPIIENRMLRRLPCHPPIARPRGRSACARRKRGGKLCRRRWLVRRRCGRRDTRSCAGAAVAGTHARAAAAAAASA